MAERKKSAAAKLTLKLGYRSKRDDERTGGDEDKVLVAIDPETQQDFEKVIFSLVAEEEKRLQNE